MKRCLLFAALAAGALSLQPAMAQGTRTNQNLEPTCQNPGGGMDPRCIGDVTPNTERGMARQARPRKAATHVRTKRKFVDCRLRANRNKSACRR